MNQTAIPATAPMPVLVAPPVAPSVAASRSVPFGRDVVVLGLGFAAVLFIVSSVIWWVVTGIDPVTTALPKLVGISADAVLAVLISLVLWRMSARRLGIKALVACLLSLIGAFVSAVVDRGLQIYMTQPDVAPIDPQYFASVVTFTTSELFGWSCLYLALQYASQIRETERRLAEARQLAVSAQLRALQYQVSPHFLFNTLNSVAGLIEEGAAQPASDMVLRLAVFLRKTLALDPLSDMPLEAEIALQLDYLAIEEVRFSDRLAVHLDLPADLQTALVPALILQPLVENAIKHGVSRCPGRADLAIGAARRPGDRLLVWIENPIPEAEAEAQDGMGIGLRNVAERLATRYPGNASCAARVIAPGRLRTELDLPVLR
ncbi:sensor histidine kinase [Paracoccus lutimaris]|uniref:Histidine kinase n=1 Tax=Paracoccus lutimaris TaxID=1490030 RepID=A0A368YJR2_9RHOB|nr:histidine kinase [Paracoccus lutimaris]RCW80481.1 histidine kinase [Paracoccus lutimaris]